MRGASVTAVAMASALTCCGQAHRAGSADAGVPSGTGLASGAGLASGTGLAPAPGAEPDGGPAAVAPDGGAAASTDGGAAAPPDGMLFVPAGTFTMGADSGGEADERPAHRVTLDGFWLDATEVTNADYARCVGAGACRPPSRKNAADNHLGPDERFRHPRQPVSSVAWDDAKAYCAFAGKRLPSEAEWERAARGGDDRRYPWGNDPPTPAHAVFEVAVTGEVGTHPRGDGPFGHHDLGGNVWEWVADVYDPYAYQRSGAPQGRGGDCSDAMSALADIRRKHKSGFTGSNPLPFECERVLRGGGFNYAPNGLRVTNRVHHPPRFRLVMAGFRCARDP